MQGFLFWKICFLFLILYFKSEITEGVLNGIPSQRNQHRYTVSVLGARQLHLCTGSIIGTHHVLSSAQCFIDESNQFIQDRYWIYTAITDISNPLGIAIDVDRIYVRSQLESEDVGDSIEISADGIAVLKLRQAIDISDISLARKLKLPEISDKVVTYEDQIAVLSSFGSQTLNSVDVVGKVGRNSRHYTPAKVIPNSMCKIQFEDIQDWHLCTILNKQASVSTPTCLSPGDLGSPLVVDNTIIGVVAGSSYECKVNKYIGIYSRVTSYLVLILKAMKDERSPYIRVAAYRRCNLLSKITRKNEELFEITDNEALLQTSSSSGSSCSSFFSIGTPDSLHRKRSPFDLFFEKNNNQ